MGGTCVNKGCVPSKALLAASGKVREIADYEHLAKFGIHMEFTPVISCQNVVDYHKDLFKTLG